MILKVHLNVRFVMMSNPKKSFYSPNVIIDFVKLVGLKHWIKNLNVHYVNIKREMLI